MLFKVIFVVALKNYRFSALGWSVGWRWIFKTGVEEIIAVSKAIWLSLLF